MTLPVNHDPRRKVPGHFEIVDGVRLPVRLSGHPALDFCNTWAGWNGGATGEYLVDYDALALWSVRAGLLPRPRAEALRLAAPREPEAAAAVLERALRFRSDFHEVVLRGSRGRRWQAVAAQAQAAAATLLLRERDGLARWEIGEQAGLEAPLLAVAWSAAELLASPELASLRACPGSGCGWLFLDRSGRRRWCSMSVCGNRAKVRRFAERRRGHGASA